MIGKSFKYTQVTLKNQPDVSRRVWGDVWMGRETMKLSEGWGGMALIYLALDYLKYVRLNDSVSVDGTALSIRPDTHGTN